MDIRKRIDVFWPYLHAIPEPAFREMKTSAFVAEVLRKAGYEVQEKVGGTTGVVGVLDSGRPGPVAAVRSDMDCLLFKQEDGTEKAVHACGHDGHMTTVLRGGGMACGRGNSLRKSKNPVPAGRRNRKRRSGHDRRRNCGRCGLSVRSALDAQRYGTNRGNHSPNQLDCLYVN